MFALLFSPKSCAFPVCPSGFTFPSWQIWRFEGRLHLHDSSLLGTRQTWWVGRYTVEGKQTHAKAWQLVQRCLQGVSWEHHPESQESFASSILLKETSKAVLVRVTKWLNPSQLQEHASWRSSKVKTMWQFKVCFWIGKWICTYSPNCGQGGKKGRKKRKKRGKSLKICVLPKTIRNTIFTLGFALFPSYVLSRTDFYLVEILFLDGQCNFF